jgi:hypothetical protein
MSDAQEDESAVNVADTQVPPAASTDAPLDGPPPVPWTPGA